MRIYEKKHMHVFILLPQTQTMSSKSTYCMNIFNKPRQKPIGVEHMFVYLMQNTDFDSHSDRGIMKTANNAS